MGLRLGLRVQVLGLRVGLRVQALWLRVVDVRPQSCAPPQDLGSGVGVDGYCKATDAKRGEVLQRVQGAGFRVQGSGCRVQGAGFRVQESGCRVQGAEIRMQGSGCRQTCAPPPQPRAPPLPSSALAPPPASLPPPVNPHATMFSILLSVLGDRTKFSVLGARAGSEARLSALPFRRSRLDGEENSGALPKSRAGRSARRARRASAPSSSAVPRAPGSLRHRASSRPRKRRRC